MKIRELVKILTEEFPNQEAIVTVAILAADGTPGVLHAVDAVRNLPDWDGAALILAKHD